MRIHPMVRTVAIAAVSALAGSMLQAWAQSSAPKAVAPVAIAAEDETPAYKALMAHAAATKGLIQVDPQSGARKLPSRQVEIFRAVPGKHEEWLRDVAAYDQVKAAAGLPPRELYVHQDGANWDFMIIQPAEASTPKQKELMAAERKRLGLPTGGQFFLRVRTQIAEHTETVAYGPVTAADYLRRIEDDKGK